VATIEFQTDFGRLSVVATSRGVTRIVLPGGREGKGARGLPKGASPERAAEAMAARAKREILEYLAGRRRTFTVPTDPTDLPPFQAKVLRATRQIAWGRTMTYAQLAAAVGRPRGARAVGQAMARNPLPLVIPCHRVTSREGLGGYGGGLEMKRRLLALEGSLVPGKNRGRCALNWSEEHGLPIGRPACQGDP
jgi:methylated-DNA-[protein]-cysteine S-methyltransferase